MFFFYRGLDICKEFWFVSCGELLCQSLTTERCGLELLCNCSKYINSKTMNISIALKNKRYRSVRALVIGNR